MNQEHSFETIPFEIAPEFQGEMFEEESEWGWGSTWLPAAWTSGGGTLSPYNKPSVAPNPVPSTAKPSLPNATRFPVSESSITSLLPTFTDYSYDFKSVRYPWAIQGVSLPLAPPKLINCCTFVEALLWKAWANTYGQAFQWNSKRHGQMMITSANDLFSPVTAVIEAEMGTPVPANQPPSTWCLLQGWRSSTSGHTFIIVAYHAATDRVLTLEANAAYSIKGVGHRNFGSLRDFPGGRPPSRWWENSAAPTWQGILGAYPQGLKMAKLNVYGLSWSGLPI